jgi:hypothetical protein
MNKIILVTFFCLGCISAFAQTRACKDSLWYFTTQQKEEISQYDTIAGCTVCQNITMSGKLLMTGLDNCDSTLDISLDSMSIVILNKVCSRYDEVCAPCQQLHYSPPCITCLDSNISVSGRLVIYTGHKKHNDTKPAFEIHPVYAIKWN